MSTPSGLCSPPIAMALSTDARVELMQTPLRPTPRETTEVMVRNIGRELAEI